MSRKFSKKTQQIKGVSGRRSIFQPEKGNITKRPYI